MSQLDEAIEAALDASAGSFRRRMAVSDLAKSEDERALETLVVLLEDDDTYLRREVVSSLSRQRDERVVEPLIAALSDDDDYIQRDAAAALGRFGDERAAESLRSLLEDQSYSVRDAAKRALEEIERQAASRPRTPPAPAPDAPPSVPDAADDAVDSEPEASMPSTVTTEVPSPVDVAIFTADAKEADEPAEEAAEVLIAEPVIHPTSTEAESPWPTTPLSEAEPATSPEIVSAEVVTKTSAEVLVDAEPPPAEGFLVYIPDGFSWERARRMQAFFADELPELRCAYEQLDSQQKSLLDIERKRHEVLRQLGFRRADKDDDLSRCSEYIETTQEELKGLERSAARTGHEIKRLETEADSVGHQIMSAIWSDKADRNKRMRSEMQAAVKKLNDKIEEARNRLATSEKEYEELSGPLRKLQATTESLTAEKDSAAQAIREANRQIDERIMSTIRRLPRKEFDARLKRLAALATNSEYFDTCVRELMRVMSELDATASQMETVEAELKEAIESSRQDSDSLGAAIAAGFCTATIGRKTPVRLSGSVHFKEDHSFFGGYSGASGSATGSGSGQASYTVDEVSWAPPRDLQDLVAGFSESWGAFGEKSARREILSATAASCRRGVDEYLHFIRAELERDFAGS